MGFDLYGIFGPMLAVLTAMLPAILGALVALLIGWMFARAIGGLAERLTYKVTHNPRVQRLVDIKDDYRVDRVVGKVVYYLLMVFVLVLFFDILGVSAVMGPFLVMANEFTSAIPRIVQAGLIFLVAWLLATLLRGIAIRLMTAPTMGRFLSRVGVAEGEAARTTTVTTAGNVVYYLVLLVFLPAILDALQLQGLSRPLESMLGEILGFLPNLLAAAVTLLIGYVAARIARGIVSHFLGASGLDGLPDKVGMAKVFEATPLSRVVGTVVFVLILLPVAISALETLGVAAISVPAISMLTVVLNMLPSVVVAVLLLGIGIAAARWVGQMVAALLTNTNFPQLLSKWGLTRTAETESRVPHVIGSVATGILVLLVTAEVFEILRLPLLSGILREILLFLPNVAVAVVILAVGWGVGAFANSSLRQVLTGTAYPAWLGTVAKVAIMVVAVMMALEQLGVAQSIVVNAFTILLGSLGLATALAVGLGSKDLVQQWMQRWTPPGGQQ